MSYTWNAPWSVAYGEVPIKTITIKTKYGLLIVIACVVALYGCEAWTVDTVGYVQEEEVPGVGFTGGLPLVNRLAPTRIHLHYHDL